MKRLLFFLWALLFMHMEPVSAQINSQRPFEGHFYCSETGVNLYLNLYEENIAIPNFSFLGKTHGYMNGNIYGTWMLVKHDINKNTATLRFTNDIGSDTQVVEFIQNADSTYSYQTLHGNAIKKAIGRKLVKITNRMTFKRK